MQIILSQKISLAKSQKRIGNNLDVINLLKEVIELNPNLLEAQIELDFTLWSDNQLFHQLELTTKLIHHCPENPYLYMLLGHIYKDKEYLVESSTSYNTAIFLSPNTVSFHHALAIFLKEYSDFEKALQEYIFAHFLDENNPELNNNIGMLYLLLGKYESSFYEYEWRKKKIIRYGERDFSQPLWQGEDLDGKILLIDYEQG